MPALVAAVKLTSVYLNLLILGGWQDALFVIA
jgi:hypothetical protein